MSNRYAPIPNPRSNENARSEMEAAFDDSEDEEDIEDVTENHPLAANYRPRFSTPPQTPSAIRVPGTYDFENVDYDYPPPGSPPRPSAVALPNDLGNSNGIVPSFDSNIAFPNHRRGWFSRTAASVLPTYYVDRFRLGPQRPRGVVGGGLNNDGVFANVTAKPTPPRVVQDGDDTYLVPEDSRADAPPSYASAQADAVPPYWETTIHAPYSSNSMGDMIIDNLHTGSLFSFLWNMLVSISFQFVGFLLTYLLHTTHAARLGSRAGLGVTLIQYGFALRGRYVDGVIDSGEGDGIGGGSAGGGWFGSPKPTFATAAEAEEYYRNLNMTMPATTTIDAASSVSNDSTTQWVSFFLMTVGWFILLTSVLGFWRVKRWERSILAANRPAPTEAQIISDRTVAAHLHNVFGLNGISRSDFFRQGFGLTTPRDREATDEVVEITAPVETGDPARDRANAIVFERERRLRDSLVNAGLI